ncbi:hypothetical protein [Rhizobium leguminosarum]|nr:hypothetical protein [Rhizobium leguminosarum]
MLALEKLERFVAVLDADALKDAAPAAHRVRRHGLRCSLEILLA